MSIEWNEEGLDEIKRNLEERFSAGLNVPLGGTEADAVLSVRDQLVQMGVEPNEDALLEKVRQVRDGHGR